ncbi:MFS transporter [Brevundimonas sp. NPDC092305]|uniref:MFS transporter n=1 Tax=Brevundimonas sp. NPDC092305 TaxID=3363957 RepID=UPI00380F9172
MLRHMGGMYDAPTPKTRALSWRFMVGYGLAQAGAFICFIPLLTLLLPMKAEAIGADDKAVLLGQVAMIGGLAAAGANLLFGVLSDRTRGPFGRRRPWIIVGVMAFAVAMALIGWAQDRIALILAVVVFQIAVNAVYGPLTALVPDMVPNARKGLVSAWAGAALPVATFFTATVVATIPGPIGARLLVVTVVAALLILPFALTVREPRPTSETPGLSRFSFAALRRRNFGLAFLSRLLMESAIAIHTLYLLFLIQSLDSRPSGMEATTTFSLLLVVGTASAMLSGFAGGVLSDRIGARRPLVVIGGLGMAAALMLLAAPFSWPMPFIAQALFGIGHGLHATTVAAMTAEILPDPGTAGRDLGVMNLAVALPQSLAPALAVGAFTLGASLVTVFALAGVGALIACVMLAPMRFPASV